MQERKNIVGWNNRPTKRLENEVPKSKREQTSNEEIN